MERFQRTRGVLRLMAVVINVLWEAQDGRSASNPPWLLAIEPSPCAPGIDSLPGRCLERRHG